MENEQPESLFEKMADICRPKDKEEADTVDNGWKIFDKKWLLTVHKAGAVEYGKECFVGGASWQKEQSDKVVSVLLDALKWISDPMLTSSDGGDAWCAVRNREGAQAWIKSLESAITQAENFISKI